MVKQVQSPIALVVFAYLVVYIVWGSTFFFIEKALHAFPPFVIGSIRFLIAGSLLMGYCALKGYRLFERRAVKQAAFVGFLLLFIDMAAIIWSEQFVSSGIVSIISAATVIWFVILDKPRWKQNFSSPTTVIGLIMGFVGVFMLFAEQIFNNHGDEHDQSMILIAMIVMTMGTIAWTIGSLYTKYARKGPSTAKDGTPQRDQPKDLHVMVKTAWQMLTAGVAFTIVGSTNGDYRSFDISAVSLEYWGAIIYLITMGSILAFSSYIWLLQVRPATEVSTHAYVNPIVALLLAHFFTDHVVTGLQIVGLTIVLSSVLLMNWSMYADSKLIHNFKRKRRIKKLRNMAPQASIPRIVQIADFAEETKKEKVEDL